MDLYTKTKAVIVFSGGQDSTTCLFWAMKHYNQVYPITFDYGQRHSVQVEKAEKIIEYLTKSSGCYNTQKLMTVNLDFLNKICVSNLLNDNSDINEKHSNNEDVPSSFVPNRNVLFLTLAHSYAQKVGASIIITGVSQTDYSGYPDCREYVIRQLQHTLNDASNTDIKIVTPLMYMTKAETFEVADNLHVLDFIIDWTNTCYNGNKFEYTRHDWGWGCDNCPACQLRKQGWLEFQDKLYQNKKR